MNPTSFKPMVTTDFIGKARKVAELTTIKIEKLKANGHGKLCYLLSGPPGVGKSALAHYIARLLTGHELAIEHVNGQSCTIDLVRKWRDNTCYRPLWGDYNVKWIDEVDHASAQARAELLTYLDTLPVYNAVIATTNVDVNSPAGIEKRLQSRFQHLPIPAVTMEELVNWLTSRWQLPKEVAEGIAKGSCGDVRQSLQDVETWMDVQAMKNVAA